MSTSINLPPHVNYLVLDGMTMYNTPAEGRIREYAAGVVRTGDTKVDVRRRRLERARVRPWMQRNKAKRVRVGLYTLDKSITGRTCESVVNGILIRSPKNQSATATVDGAMAGR